MMKLCTECKVEKPLDAFGKRSAMKAGLRSCCKLCDAERQRRKPISVRREQKLLRRYGMSLEDYDQMFSNQNGCCAICKRHQSEFPCSLSVDHCHTSGKVRGLLCKSCNLVLGYSYESPSILEGAANYARNWRGV